MKKRILFTVVTIIFLTALKMTAQNLPRLGRDPVSRVISAMTPEEKASFVVGTGMRIPGLSNMIPGSNDAGAKDLVPGSAGMTRAIPRLGIPAMVVADGPAGLRISPERQDDQKKYYCTAFPVASQLASTWDRELVTRVGEAMGNEVLEYGVDIILGPGMNIQKNPLGGRNFEYFSEDPLITGEMASSIITGIQGTGTGTSPKHFAANNAETNRNSLNTIVSERALREIYLRGFEIAVKKAQPWTIMSSYNLINDVYAPENRDLLSTVLRDDWGFRGFVMTDWFGGNDPVAMVKAGNDLLMPGVANQTQLIMKAIDEGSLDIDVLDRNIARILNVVVKSPRFRGYDYSNDPDLEAHAEIARAAGSDGMVLLKNDESALPLTDIRKLALFGNMSYNLISGGTGSGDVNEAYTVSLSEGLENAGFATDERLRNLYRVYLDLAGTGRPSPAGILSLLPRDPIPELVINTDIIKGVAASTEAAIITIGRISGEGRDRQNAPGDFLLTDAEFQLVSDVSNIYGEQGKKVIVVLNIGGVIETASWKEFPDAILLAWQGGQEAGNSIADIISGKVNPSGRLAITFPVSYEDVPSSKTFPGKELPEGRPGPDSPVNVFMRTKPALVYYDDGIYVGYRYYETFDVKPSYEFGYGLSFTQFEYSGLKLSSARFTREVNVTVEIRNTGTAAGKEVVQLYLSAPKIKLHKPDEELRGFTKTKILQPGESQVVSFRIDRQSLASFDPESSSWIAEEGDYEVRIGASSRDIRQTASFSLARDIVVQKVNRALVPKDRIQEIRP